MKKLFLYTILLAIIVLLLQSCSQINKNETATRIAEIEKLYQDSINALRQELSNANAKIETLSYPADQRFAHIVELFNSGDYDGVKKEVSELTQVFPFAKEIEKSNDFLKKIEAIEIAKKAEEERIKALGFKAIPEKLTIDIDYNKVTFSNISVSSRFTFDSYGDRYYYRDADRGTKYVSMQMSVTSTSHDPLLPQLALYRISGDKMVIEGKFTTEYARWKDYGAYLGNYHDSTNDFSKVSTVRFKLGLQVSNEVLEKPYAIVLMKENALIMTYNRYDNPPQSYSGSANYPSMLSLEDFSDKYVIIKKYNLK